MRSLKIGVLKVWLAVGLLAVTLAGGSFMLAEGPGEKKHVGPAAAKPEGGKAATMWKERYAVEYPGSLPVSVAFSPDGKTLITGDTGGEVTALILADDIPKYRWKSKVEGWHAAVAYSADQKSIYATTKNGIGILDAATGKEVGRLPADSSRPISVAVFPNKVIAETYTRSQVVFGNASGYFIKSWADGKLPDTVSTIETGTVEKGTKPFDDAAVPLAVDPKGRSAIMTGPLDGKTNKNVLWAYVCGDYAEGSPGNRVMVGHDATVVSAAWTKEGGTAVTGDADGRVIVWDAKTMKEKHRLELRGRIAALAMSDDGTKTAAYVLGKIGEVFVWDTAKPTVAMKPIHTDLNDFGGLSSFASLYFSPDGKQLAGCAGDKKWLNRLGELIGKVRVWELTDEPKAQRPPRHLYTIPLPKGSSSSFAIEHNHVMIAPSAKEGAIDYRDPRDGSILSRLILGKFSIGRIALSSDRHWMAVERHPAGNGFGVGIPAQDFVADIWNRKTMKRDASIPGVGRILDAGAGQTALVREKKIEIWDNASCVILMAAPFSFTRIDAARFTPDGKTLAIADANDLVLWRWTENAHERIEKGHATGSLAFSPDGKFLAEGPKLRENITIRDMATRQITKTLVKDNRVWMSVPQMHFAQGGRVLIATDTIEVATNVPTPHRINLWDTLTGRIAHGITISSGIPKSIELSPNGRYLLATVEDVGEMKLTAWEIAGKPTVQQPNWTEGKPIAVQSWPVAGLAVSSDGKMLATVSDRGTVSIYDPDSGTRLDKGRVAQLKAPAKKVGIAFSPTGKLGVTTQNGVAIFDRLLDEVPHFFGGPNIWEGIPDFEPHQIAFYDEVKPEGWSDSKDGRFVATDGVSFKELGWTYINENGKEDWKRHRGEVWTSWAANRHKPTMLASAPGTNRVFYSAGPDAAGKPDSFDVHVRDMAAKPQTVRAMSGHRARPTAGAVSPDGKLFLSGDGAGDLIAWDGVKFQKRNHWKLGGAIANVAISSDNKTGAVLRSSESYGNTDWSLFLFDFANPPSEPTPFWTATFAGPFTGNASLAFHPNGMKLYSAFGEPYGKPGQPGWAKSAGIRVWEKANATVPAPPAAVALPPVKLAWTKENPITSVEFDIQSLAFAPDGSKFAICSNGQTLVYDATTSKKLYEASGCFPWFVKSSLYTWALLVTEYDANTGKLLKQYPEAKTEFGWKLASFSPDGKLVAGCDGAEIQLRYTASGIELRRLQRQSRTKDDDFTMKGVAWSPDGSRITGFQPTVEITGSGGLAVWDVNNGERIARRSASMQEFNGGHACFTFAPDGKTVAVGGLHYDSDKNSSLAILDAATLKNVRDPVPVRSRDGGADVTSVAYSPDGGTIAIGVKLHSGKAPLNRVQLYNAMTLEPGESLLPDHDTAPITALAFAPDGRTLVGTTGEGPFSDPQKKETLHRVLIWRGVPSK